MADIFSNNTGKPLQSCKVYTCRYCSLEVVIIYAPNVMCVLNASQCSKFTLTVYLITGFVCLLSWEEGAPDKLLVNHRTEDSLPIQIYESDQSPTINTVNVERRGIDSHAPPFWGIQGMLPWMNWSSVDKSQDKNKQFQGAALKWTCCFVLHDKAQVSFGILVTLTGGTSAWSVVFKCEQLINPLTKFSLKAPTDFHFEWP